MKCTNNISGLTYLFCYSQKTDMVALHKLKADVGVLKAISQMLITGGKLTRCCHKTAELLGKQCVQQHKSLIILDQLIRIFLTALFTNYMVLTVVDFLKYTIYVFPKLHYLLIQ